MLGAWNSTDFLCFSGNLLVIAEYFVGDLAMEHLLVVSQEFRDALLLKQLFLEERHRNWTTNALFGGKCSQSFSSRHLNCTSRKRTDWRAITDRQLNRHSRFSLLFMYTVNYSEFKWIDKNGRLSACSSCKKWACVCNVNGSCARAFSTQKNGTFLARSPSVLRVGGWDEERSILWRFEQVSVLNSRRIAHEFAELEHEEERD